MTNFLAKLFPCFFTPPAPAVPVAPPVVTPPPTWVTNPAPVPAPVVLPPIPAPTIPPAAPASNFDAAFDYTIGNEGGYSNNPNDSGGPTNWGITIHDYSRWLGSPASADEVKAMTKATAKLIYKPWYWDVISLDQVHSKGVAMAMFDMGVVRGTATIAKAVQTIVGVTADAHIGPLSLTAINSHDSAALIDAIEAQAIRAFTSIADNNPKDREFLAGWINRSHRLAELKQFA